MSHPSRYELTDHQWSRLESLLPGKPSDPGRSGLENSLLLELSRVLRTHLLVTHF